MQFIGEQRFHEISSTCAIFFFFFFKLLNFTRSIKNTEKCARFYPLSNENTVAKLNYSYSMAKLS